MNGTLSNNSLLFLSGAGAWLGPWLYSDTWIHLQWFCSVFLVKKSSHLGPLQIPNNSNFLKFKAPLPTVFWDKWKYPSHFGAYWLSNYLSRRNLHPLSWSMWKRRCIHTSKWSNEGWSIFETRGTSNNIQIMRMSGAAFGGCQLCTHWPLNVMRNGETVMLMHELTSW